MDTQACEDEASYYLAFELCTGGTLLEAIENRYATDWEHCVYATWISSGGSGGAPLLEKQLICAAQLRPALLPRFRS